jgi:NHL repeat
MDRRFALLLVAAVGLAALTGSGVGMADEQAPAPGTITTVAGTGQVGFSGDGGPATQARLNIPFGVTVDSAGNLFIADGNNYRVRKAERMSTGQNGGRSSLSSAPLHVGKGNVMHP